ncbi:hypothetical protein [Gemella sanguinis]|uniref:hypothetical protein n=1 Tax=Gemella sanguinis TaxID=84135 RepID=UPI0004E1D569|nr:hypothetical protein [Gemella sanguinis]NKZ25401.1 hypothetical protein [Gemella sanguinis]
MRKQILAVMVGLSVVLSGCSSQSTESMLQEVKKDTKEIKSGKVTLSLSLSDEKEGSKGNTGYEMSGDEKFDPLELKMNGKFSGLGKGLEVEDYIKDGVYYTKNGVGSKAIWFKKKVSTDNKHALSFKSESLNMNDDILNLLDNKDNWDVTKDGDKVTFKLKKTDELKNKVKEIHNKELKKDLKFSEFDYNIEYVFNKKTNDVEKLYFEISTKTEGTTSKATNKGSLEEINKEVNIELPEESKKALEMLA